MAGGPVTDLYDSNLRRFDRCPQCDGEGGAWDRPCEACDDSGEAKMTVVFDGQDDAIVSVPHGRYRVVRSRPANHFRFAVADVPGPQLETTGAGKVRLIRGPGRAFPLELLDVMVLAAMAFRDRDAPAAA